MRKDRWLILLVAAALLAPLFPVRAQALSRWENDDFLMTLDRDKLVFEIASKENGASFLSALKETDSSLNAQWRDFLSSSISIEYAEETANTPTRAGLLSGGVTWEIGEEATGFYADVRFTEQQIALRLVVSLTEDGVRMTVPAERIEESGELMLCGVYIAPAFGATLRGEKEGYMLLPEAAGAVVEYAEGRANASAPYMKSIYGDNAGVQEQTADRRDYPAPRAEQKIYAPLYGMARTEDRLAALCLIEGGQDNAQIMCYAAGIVTPYHFIGARMILRDRYFKLNSSSRGAMVNEKEMQARDLSVRVCLLTGDAADYNGMAARYRRYLIEERGLTPVQKRFSVRLDFLAAETERGVVSDGTVVAATVADMETVLSAFAGRGVTAVDAVYTGWQPGGKTAGYGLMTGAIDGRLGDAQALYALAEAVSSRGGTLSIAQDLLYAWQGRGYARDALARKINRQALQLYTNRRAYAAYSVLSPLYALDVARVTAKLAAGALGVAVTGAPSAAFSYAVSGDESYTRRDTLAQYGDVFALLSRDQALMLSEPFAEYWAYADAFLDLPLGAGDYSLVTYDVPFLTMALDGLIPVYGETLNFSADPDESLLKMIEYGVKPSYLLTMASSSVLRRTNSENVFTSQWEDLLPEIVSLYETLGALWQKIDGGVMIAHERLADGLVRLTYDNGIAVYVNEGRTDVLSPDGVVPSRGFLCAGGES